MNYQLFITFCYLCIMFYCTNIAKFLSKNRLLLLVAEVFLLLAGSCTTAYRIKQADKLFAEGAYAQAADKYSKVILKLPRDRQPAIQLKLAESSRLIGNTRQAEMSYERAISKNMNQLKLAESYRAIGKMRQAENVISKNAKVKDTVYLNLAQSKLALEKYAEALTYYDKYLAAHPNDSLAAAQRQYSEQMTDTIAPKHTRYIVSNAKEFNSPKDDFAPAFLSDDYSAMAFTSSREEAQGKRKNIVTGDKNTDIFTIKQTRTGKWERAIALKGKVNTKYDDGVCCFTHDFQKMYFSECVAKGRKSGCHLYVAIYDAETTSWEEVEQLLTSDSASNMAHPCLSDDETELYFVSDREGGSGGMDIWKMARTSNEEGETWSEPVNLGTDINTPGDEMYPYVHANGALYFASNGHKGFGGLDIFKATQQDDRSWKVENMGLPINSSADDFSIIFETGREAGYFASRRKGGRGGDDIYRFVLPEAKFTFVGVVKHKESKQPMENIQINMLTNTGESLQLLTDADGRFSFNLLPETDYLLRVRNKGYFNEKARFTTKELEDITTLREEFWLQPMDKVIEIENIFYDFGKWTLRPESEESLNHLAEVLNDNPNISIVLTSHSDMHGDTAINNQVSQHRAQAVVDYLIAKGIATTRLTAVGKGKSQPREVNAALSAQYKFLREGDVLDDNFIRQYIRTKQEEEIVDQLNRRTEFTVVSQ